MTLIKRLISLALLALLASATWHFFQVMSAHYKFKDAVEYALQNRADKTDENLHDQIVDIASQADIPVEPDAIVVTHVGIASRAVVSYTRPIEILPTKFYPLPLSFIVDTFVHQDKNSVKSPE